MGEFTGTHDQSAGRLKVNPPTGKVAGSSAWRVAAQKSAREVRARRFIGLLV
jgi:hypothetical protein